ncbi:uncharacterized protein LOC141634206 isoform X2 [Silene latifolia]|uniref:uncharacterized protein LOC141634206 isoform X2 n=1 Tax=Silene latifolia TaxID=37657 RepID=UPI003D786D25
MPLNDDEKRLQMPVVITCNEIRREVSAAQLIAKQQIDWTFTFDKESQKVPLAEETRLDEKKINNRWKININVENLVENRCETKGNKEAKVSLQDSEISGECRGWIKQL